MELYSQSLEEIQRNANAVKEELLRALEREGLLTKPADEIAASYAVVVSKPGWLGGLFRKLWQRDPKNLSIDVVRGV